MPGTPQIARFAGTFALSLSLAPLAVASVSTTGEFTGDASENFENIAAPGGLPGPVAIFGGAGTVNDPLANTLVIATTVSSSDTDHENFFPHGGFLMGLVPTGTVLFEFDQPVSQFGGFFGSAALQSGGFAVFRDESGQVIDTLDFSLTAMEWGWHGWQSEVGISSIEIMGSDLSTAPFVFDDLQMTLIPAPGAVAVLALGGLFARRRRH